MTKGGVRESFIDFLDILNLTHFSLTDWTIALHLFDPSLEDNSAWVTVNFFDSKKFNLPDLKDGDAIVLSGLNVSSSFPSSIRYFIV